ncbi:type II toxin-antitoxin system RelE/ParE family toxin [Parafilimonas terrae]|jgi:mRNA-degrading endonuclease YafQ of YafQ-DinJ toxin-antitoxin module|uniref:mRNA-degrading endonuclease (mRNA interferase) YafQ, toxin component of the YafQ-DinJ toxin-antitoxin module n=1 Tax=Parafilimonas terrae TaxID=1465490 RepID=A0A1I5UYF5_9BACT|nr:type II toxin-antitoxin system YafQ family toxin [Parafilimonas terrae]SFQ00305.1 mRNA-degrading endonuclease (mRNA interferase) YafQ, toxin component of the YafQ-DinJ toxin-antitoxin module [Parafilimonas terrae]
MKIELSAKFRKAYRKLSVRKPDIATIALEKILLFSQQPNNPILKFHKLQGDYNGQYSFSVAYDVRIIVDLIDSDTAVLTMIGSHDEVY